MNDSNPIIATLAESETAVVEFDRQRWELAWQSRAEYAKALQQVSKDLPRAESKQLALLNTWFETNQSLDQLFTRPDALQAFLPVYFGVGDQTADDHLTEAVKMGLWSQERKQFGSKHILRLLYVPLLVGFICLTFIVVGCLWLIPQFDSIFTEFGIDPPRITKALFGFSRFVQEFWWLLLSSPLLAIVMIAVLDRKGKNNRPVNVSWLDTKLTSFRCTLADWAWHVSLLLDAGFTQQESTEIASAAICNGRKRREITERLEGRGLDESEYSPVAFREFGFPLLDLALQQPNHQCKSSLLKEIAKYYWDLNQNNGSWWVSWLAIGIMWMFWAMVGLTVLALFNPLIAIIRGLYW